MTLAPAGIDRAMARIGQIQAAASPPGFGRLVEVASGRTLQDSLPSPASGVVGIHSVASTPLPAGAQRWAGAIRQAAQRHGIDPDLLTAVVWTESGFVPDAVSQAGAIGLAQLMPHTAAAMGVDPTDPIQNLDGGARYLREMLDRFGRVDLALAAYNAGPTRLSGLLDGSGGVPISHDYVETVLTRANALGGNR